MRRALMLAPFAAGWILIRLGDHGLGVPLRSSDELTTWLKHTEPAVMAMALVRLAGLGLCGYLAVALSATVVAAVAGQRRASTRLSRLLPSVLRWSLAGSVVLTSSVAGSRHVAAAPVDGHERAGGDDQSAHATETATMIKLTDPGAPTTTEKSPPRSPHRTENDPLASEVTDGPDNLDSPDDRWVVQPGDSFWSIAVDVLAEGDPNPTDLDTAAYWQELIAANRDRLADPYNTDLLFAGQELQLPR